MVIKDTGAVKKFIAKSSLVGVELKDYPKYLNNLYNNKIKFSYLEKYNSEYRLSISHIDKDVKCIELPDIDEDFDYLEMIKPITILHSNVASVKLPKSFRLTHNNSLSLYHLTPFSRIFLWDTCDYDVIIDYFREASYRIHRDTLFILQHTDGRKPEIIKV